MRDNRINGAPEEIRTPDPQIRSLVLYPAELRARFSLGHHGPDRPDGSEWYRNVAKVRFSYPLRVGLASSGNALPGANTGLNFRHSGGGRYRQTAVVHSIPVMGAPFIGHMTENH